MALEKYLHTIGLKRQQKPVLIKPDWQLKIQGTSQKEFLHLVLGAKSPCNDHSQWQNSWQKNNAFKWQSNVLCKE